MESWLYLEPLRACMEDYLRQRGLSTKRPFTCLNPQHEDKHPSMSYNMKIKNVHCFSCGMNYDLFDLIGMDYKLSEFSEQYNKACELFGFDSKVSANNEINIKSNRDINILTTSDRHAEYLELKKSAGNDLSYLLDRGVAMETCHKYGIFIRDKRAYLPIFEKDICTGWTARSTDEKTQPRYKNSSGPIGIFNSDKLFKHGAGKCLFVTEGIFDTLILEQLGVDSISICGSQNVKKLLKLCSENIATASTWRIICCGDPDKAGKAMNSELKEGLKRLGFLYGELIIPENSGDINELYLNNVDKLNELIHRCQKTDNISNIITYEEASAGAALLSFFEEYNRRTEKSGVSTGFYGLDKLLDGGFYSGLYIIGAISSLGKTSFILQVSDYIAENERDVLFFSLEQSRYELIAKSLSRITAVLDKGLRRNAFTIRQILSGMPLFNCEKDRLLNEAKEIYAKFAGNLFIREGMADIGVSEIRAAVREHITMRKTKPVVIVDYLQILRPYSDRSTDKQNIDRAVVELKRISRDFDVPVIAISSFNRENYRAAVSMEAFKESGAVEYSADVLLGLQFKGAGNQGFDVNAAKSREPRQVELIMLKNRNGIPYAKLEFDYDAKFGWFGESVRETTAMRSGVKKTYAH